MANALTKLQTRVLRTAAEISRMDRLGHVDEAQTLDAISVDEDRASSSYSFKQLISMGYLEKTEDWDESYRISAKGQKALGR